MTQTKDPTAHPASASRAVVEGKSGVTPTQTALPLFPELEGTANPTPSGREWTVASNEDVRNQGSGNALSSREKRPVRRQRLKSPISVIAIKRVLKAADTAGLPISALEVRPDGTIVLSAGTAADDVADDVFAKWADRL